MLGIQDTLREWLEKGKVLYKSGERKTLFFSLLNLLLGLGYAWGVFSSNALLISRIGTASLFYVYLGSALSALILVGLFYGLVDRFPRRQVFWVSFEILGVLTLLIWAIALKNPSVAFFYFGIRIFFYAVFILTTLEFWLVVSDYFTNFEAKLRYPSFVAFGVVGEMIGSFTIQVGASRFHAMNFLLLWGLVLILCPLLLLSIRMAPADGKRVSSGLFKKETEDRVPPLAMSLLSLLVIFWVSHVFLAYGLDYFYNTSALSTFGSEDHLASFFGKVALVSLILVFIYQIFFATRITLDFGVERTLWGLCSLYIVGMGLVCFFPSLTSLALAECLIFFFADLSAQSLFQPINKVFPAKIRGRIMVLVEAIGFPGGTVLLLMASLLLMGAGHPERLGLILFAGGLGFLFFPLLFEKVYLRYLMGSLGGSDESLTINVVQALGEPNKKKAAAALLERLKGTSSISLQRTILLSLGRMRSAQAFETIMAYFSVPNESIQLAVVDSLSYFKNEEGRRALLDLMRSNENVSFQVRMSVTLLLTERLGARMLPYLLDLLKSDNERVIANAIESLALLKEHSMVPVLLPYLAHENRRIRANAAIALFPFRETRLEALETIDQLFHSQAVMEAFSGIYAAGELRLKKYREQLMGMWNSADKRLRQHATVALAKMGDLAACERMTRLLLDPEESFVLETARHLDRFPRMSLLMIFEKISNLPSEDKALILQRLDQTPLDFSAEKELLKSGEWMSPYFST